MTKEQEVINFILNELINIQKMHKAADLKTIAVKKQQFARAAALREAEKRYASMLPYYKDLQKQLFHD